MADPAIWDCHVHVIGSRDRYPMAATRGYTPPEAPVEALLAHLDGIGAAHAAIVQPSVYGFDNTCLCDALARAGGRCTGVAVPSPACDLAELAALHAAGVRGLRCNLVNPGGLPLEATRAWWGWMGDHGWHLDLQVDATRTDLAALLETPGLPPVVLDHMGYPPPGAVAGALAGLLGLVAASRVYVKLSAPYRISAEPPPHADAMALAAALLAASPDRCLFATDWPHTDLAAPPMPDLAWRDAVRSAAGAGWPRLHAAARSIYAR